MQPHATSCKDLIKNNLATKESLLGGESNNCFVTTPFKLAFDVNEANL